MSNLDVAVATFWQLARHWKNGEKAKLELSFEGESLHIQLSAKLGPPEQQHFPDPPPIIPSVKNKSPNQLRRQQQRQHEAVSKANLATTKESEQDASENITVVKEAEQSKESSDIKKSSIRKMFLRKLTFLKMLSILQIVVKSLQLNLLKKKQKFSHPVSYLNMTSGILPAVLTKDSKCT